MPESILGPVPGYTSELDRFLTAQGAVYPRVLRELQAGEKRSHWMWFIFPQIEGLGSSAMSRRYALRSRSEAAAYLAHPVLGPRLRECTGLVLLQPPGRIAQIFPYPDDLKFHSSMTLFAEASPADSVFAQALQQCFAGQPDPATLARLR